jgi:PAS domain S-box-containing protein
MSETRKTKTGPQAEHPSLQQNIMETATSRTGSAPSAEIRGEQAEKAYRASEERYHTILENMEEGYHESDLAGNFTFFNKSFQVIMGYPHRELMGMNYRQCAVDEESGNTIRDAHKRVFRTGESIKSLAWEIVRKDGDRRTVEVSASLIRGENDQPAGFWGVVRDITERMRTETALRESEEQYRLVVENARESIIISQDLRLVFANQTASDMIGYSEEILKSRPFTDFIHPDDRDLVATNHLKRLAGEEVPPAYPFRVVSRDGTVKWVEINAVLVPWKGRPATLNFLNDITNRKRAENRLRRSEAQYRLLAENIKDVVWTMDMNMNMTYISPSVETHLGYTPEEFIALPLSKTMSPRSFEKVTKLYQDALKIMNHESMDMRRSLSIRVEHLHKNGSPIWFDISLTFARGTEGQVAGFQGLSRNIMEQMKAEEGKQESMRNLRKSLGATIQAMAVTVETRDPYTAGHQRRVADLARSIAKEMNLSGDQIDGIRMAATIHDLGKISVPVELLTKPTRLTKIEFDLIKTHAQSGYDILKDIDFPWPIARMVLEHHERMDGSGYPNGLTRDQSLLESRILSVADVIEAMASHRPYRPGLGIEKALDEITKNRGILYDPEAVDACLRLFNEKGYRLVD